MIKEGETILLYKDKQRNYLIKVDNKEFHTDKGVIDLSKVKEKEIGQSIETNLGEKFYILKPSLWEKIMKIDRKTQIIYPKDTGVILLKSGIFPGARVIECGTGSGGLTLALANFVRPYGKVFSYERNKEFLENAKKNVKKTGLNQYVEFKLKEVKEKFEEDNIDFVMVDIGSPWELIPASYKALKPGGRFATICPSFEQLTKTVFSLEEGGFTHIESLEVLTRKILVRRGKTRPEQKIPSHTGFLVFASKVIKNL